MYGLCVLIYFICFLFKEDKREKIAWQTRKRNRCCKDVKYTDEVMEQAKNMQKSKGIKILGSGCDKCKALEQATKEALTQLQLPLEIEHVERFCWDGACVWSYDNSGTSG